MQPQVARECRGASKDKQLGKNVLTGYDLPVLKYREVML